MTPTENDQIAELETAISQAVAVAPEVASAIVADLIRSLEGRPGHTTSSAIGALYGLHTKFPERTAKVVEPGLFLVLGGLFDSQGKRSSR